MKSGIIIVVFGLAMIIASITSAQVPESINSQGRVMDLNGAPLENDPATTNDGQINLVFRIYDALSGGNVVWSQTTNNVPVFNGLFSVLLTNLTATVTNQIARWLEVEVGTSSATNTLYPRKELVSVAYAIQAGNANTLDGLRPEQILNRYAFQGPIRISGTNISFNYKTNDFNVTNNMFIVRDKWVDETGDTMIGPLTMAVGTRIIGANIIDSQAITNETILNEDIATNANIAATKIAGEALVKTTELSGMITGRWNNLTISNDVVTTAMIKDGTITNDDISPTANIAASKILVSQIDHGPLSVQTHVSNLWGTIGFVVGQTGNEQYTSIQAAIDAAAAADYGQAKPVTIEVKPGEYTEDLTLYAGIHLKAEIEDALFSVTIIGTNQYVDITPDLDDLFISGIQFISPDDATAPTFSIRGTGFTSIRMNHCVLNSRNNQPALRLSNTGFQGTRLSNTELFHCRIRNLLTTFTGNAVELEAGSLLLDDGDVDIRNLAGRSFRVSGARSQLIIGNATIRGQIATTGGAADLFTLIISQSSIDTGNNLPGIEHNAINAVALDVLFISTLAGPVVTGTGNFLYNNVAYFYSAYGIAQTLPATAVPVGSTAGGDLTGLYPNPQIAAGVITNTDVHANANIMGSKITAATITARGTVELAGNNENAANLAVQANDDRLFNARAPGGAAGGDLTGLYPNPTITNNAVTSAKIAANTITVDDIGDNAVGNAEMRDNAVGTAEIADGAIADADIAASANIAGSKISPIFGSLEVRRDNDDSQLLFHDPGDQWYSMGMDRSDGLKFKINRGGNIGANNDFTIDAAGNVGIGTASPGYKLHVAGDIYADGGWLRTRGNQGWYSESYGGGWFMEDYSWIRTYNSKNVWTASGLLGSQGGLTVGYGGVAPPSGGAIIAGNVGIGTTPSSEYKLDVNGNIRASRYYDRDNSGYYLNPDSDSSLLNIYASYIKNYGNLQVNGNVGIGTPPSGFKLDVNGNAIVRSSLTVQGGDIWLEGGRELRSPGNFGIQAYGGQLSLNPWGGKDYKVIIGTPSSGLDISQAKCYVEGNAGVSGDFYALYQGIFGATVYPLGLTAVNLYAENHAVVMRDLYVGGCVKANYLGRCSDDRLKFNEQKLEYGLAQIMALEPKRYDRAEWEYGKKTEQMVIHPEKTRTDIGLIAQEVQKIIPEAVMVPEDENQEPWLISHDTLIPVLVKAIQEQQAQIEELKKEIKAMKSGI